MARNINHRSTFDGVEKAGVAVFSGAVLFWIIYFAVKVVALVILIVNIGYVIAADNNHTLASFDFLWLVLSALGTLFL